MLMLNFLLQIWTLKAFIFLNTRLFSLVFLVTYFGVDGILRLKILGRICGISLVGVFLRRISIVVSELIKVFEVKRLNYSHFFKKKLCISILPFFTFLQVLTRSVESIHFYVPFFHTLNARLWFAYGWFSHDLFIIVSNFHLRILSLFQIKLQLNFFFLVLIFQIPNTVILVLGLLHMVLYAMYRKVKEESHHIVEHKESIETQ